MDSELDDPREDGLGQEGEQAEGDAHRNDESQEPSDKDSNTEQVMVKEAQRKMHEATTRAAENERKLLELQAKLDTVLQLQGGKETEAPKNPFDFLDDKEFLESLYDDPKNTVKALKNIISVFGETMKAQEESFSQTLAEKIGNVDPAMKALKGKIAELRKNPTLARLPDEYLAEVAKLNMPKDEEGDDFRGSLPSSGRRVSSKADDQRREEGIKYFYEKLGYGRLDKE